LTVFRCLARHFNFEYRTTRLFVLIYLPRPAIAAFGIVLIPGHDTLPSYLRPSQLATFRT
jgi:hypothetical protein